MRQQRGQGGDIMRQAKRQKHSGVIKRLHLAWSGFSHTWFGSECLCVFTASPSVCVVSVVSLCESVDILLCLIVTWFCVSCLTVRRTQGCTSCVGGNVLLSSGAWFWFMWTCYHWPWLRGQTQRSKVSLTDETLMKQHSFKAASFLSCMRPKDNESSRAAPERLTVQLLRTWSAAVSNPVSFWLFHSKKRTKDLLRGQPHSDKQVQNYTALKRKSLELL